MSQPETIAVTYDPGTGSTTKTYNRYSPLEGSTVYKENGATLLVRDELKLFRTEAKKNGTFLGMAKASAKLTLDVEGQDSEGNTVRVPIIVTASVSFNPSVAAADVNDAVHRCAALMVTEEGDDLFQNLEI